MPERILYPEFRDELEFTNYPFADGASLRGTIHTIEKDTFLDATLHPIGGQHRQYISEIEINPRRITFRISDRFNSNICHAVMNPLDPPEILKFVDEYDRPAGIMVSTPLKLTRFTTWELGVHQFQRGDTELVASCVIPTPEPGVRGIMLESGELFTGDIWIVGENGAVVRDDGDGNIRVDLVGEPLFNRVLCEPLELFEPPMFIETINGCPPNEYGEWHIAIGDHEAPETIVRLYPTNDGLRIEGIGTRKTL